MALAYGLFSGRFSFVLNTWNPRIFRCKLLRSVSLTSLVCYIIMKTNLSYWHVLQFRNILCINQWTSDKKSEISIIVICSEFMSCRYIPTGFIAFQNGRKVMVGVLFRFQIWFKQFFSVTLWAPFWLAGTANWQEFGNHSFNIYHVTYFLNQFKAIW